ncbi:unnamed protein product [Cuscuta epithymum]|uniref:Uncharacterized protein n=1 Tax=Cuscuta epithymum TaxID=186058 RepID=A0AAV0FW17_9ASTE|nr:unnamed protein product [Cuscuta epithymum]
MPEAVLGWQSTRSDERILSVGVLKNGRTERGWESSSEVEDGISAVREKLLVDLQAATDKMKDAILGAGLRDGEGKERPPAPATGSETITPVGPSETAARPWNLRTRRSGNKHLHVVTAVSGEATARPPPPNCSLFKSRNESSGLDPATTTP